MPYRPYFFYLYSYLLLAMMLNYNRLQFAGTHIIFFFDLSLLSRTDSVRLSPPTIINRVLLCRCYQRKG